MEFVLVGPRELRAHWPRISDSLDKVLAKASEDWIKEDVYHAIKSGHVACYIALSDAGYAGLLVVTKAAAEFSGTPALHVWIAHNAGAEDVLEAGLDLLRGIATKEGIMRITFGSPRAGWARRFPLISATYEVPV